MRSSTLDNPTKDSKPHVSNSSTSKTLVSNVVSIDDDSAKINKKGTMEVSNEVEKVLGSIATLAVETK